MFAARTAAEVCPRIQLGDPARALLRDGMAPRAFLDALLAAGLLPDAVRFLAAALPKREAVWWACVCARQQPGASLPPAAAAALQAAERWAADPSDANRRAAHPAAEAAGVGTPAGAAAVAAFLSGGSLAPPDLPAAPAPEQATALAVAGSVLLAAVLAEPDKAAAKRRRFVDLGLAVADGANRWKEPAGATGHSPRRG